MKHTFHSPKDSPLFINMSVFLNLPLKLDVILSAMSVENNRLKKNMQVLWPFLTNITEVTQLSSQLKSIQGDPDFSSIRKSTRQVE